MDSITFFGGKVVVLGGDFRQTFPVLPKGTKFETIAACLTNSPLWPLLCKLQLEENMIALLDPIFTDFLLRIGNGIENLKHDNIVTRPTSMVIQSDPNIHPIDVLVSVCTPTFIIRLQRLFLLQTELF